MRCPYCDEERAAADRACPSCGHRLDPDDVTGQTKAVDEPTTPGSPRGSGMRRRDFLQAAAGLALAGKAGALPLAGRRKVLAPRVTGGINIHPLRRFDHVSDFTPPVIVPELVDLQLREAYELGFDAVRITLSFNNFGPDLEAGIMYVRALRALGIHVVGILGQFGTGADLTRALIDPAKRAVVVDTYLALFASDDVLPARRRIGSAGNVTFQVMNEPANFLGISPEDYVRLFLRPVYLDMKARRPDLPIVAAASVGGRDGVVRLERMLRAGLEAYCDVVAVHVYDERVIELLPQALDHPIWVTESGVLGAANHLDWYLRTLPTLQALPQVERVFYFDLFDASPDEFRLISIAETDEGFVRGVESVELYKHLTDLVRTAAADRPLVPYSRLIPDVTRYLPTDDDYRVLDAARAHL